MLRALGIGVLVLAAAAAAFFLTPWQTVLIVRCDRTGETKLCAGVARGEEFVISYVHSVNRRPVYDTLRIEAKGMTIVKSRFDSFGAGIPEVATAEHPLRFTSDGWLEYTVNRPTPDVTIFVGRVAEHTLHIKDRAIALATLAEPGTALNFSVTRQSLYEIYRGGCLW